MCLQMSSHFLSYASSFRCVIIRAALIQIDLQKTKAEAIEHILKMLKKASSSDSDIVCLPELWYSKPIANFEEEFERIIYAAEENNMTIVPGAFLEKIDNNLHVSCPVIADNGRILGRQFKLHPFGAQKKAVKAGVKAELFESGKFRFGIGICYDIVFPEVARALVRKGADMLFFPSRIRYEGIKPWHMYVQVRALENRVPIAAPNVCGNNILYKGRSIFVDFDYDNKTDIASPKIVMGSPVREQILVLDIDLNSVRRIHRKRFQDFRNYYDSL